MSKLNLKQFHDDKICELSKELIQQAVQHLQNEFSEELVDDIQNLYAKDGADWILEHHMFWGMEIRNALREAGFKDDALPSGNWDDYYTPIVELAAGIRMIDDPEYHVKDDFK